MAIYIFAAVVQRNKSELQLLELTLQTTVLQPTMAGCLPLSIGSKSWFAHPISSGANSRKLQLHFLMYLKLVK